jgi:hypothetical protein
MEEVEPEPDFVPRVLGDAREVARRLEEWEGEDLPPSTLEDMTEEDARLEKLRIRLSELRSEFSGDGEIDGGRACRVLMELVDEFDWLRFAVRSKNHQLDLMDAEVRMSHRIVIEQEKDKKKMHSELVVLRGELGAVVSAGGAESVRDLLSGKRGKPTGRRVGSGRRGPGRPRKDGS